MQILFAPATVTEQEWSEIQATVSALRGEEFAYGEAPDNATAIVVAPAVVAAAPVTAPPPPAEQVSAEQPAVEVAPVAASEQLLAAAAAAKVTHGVDIDVNGIPWDARIHSKPPVKTAKNEWRKKRQVDETLFANVTAELKQAMAAPPATAPAAETAPAATAPAAPPPPETPAATATDAAQPVATAAIAVEGNASAPPAPAAATAPEAAPVVPAPTPELANTASGPDVAATASSPFAELMKSVVAKQAAGLTTPEKVVENCQALGLTGIRDLALRVDLIPAFEALVAAG